MVTLVAAPDPLPGANRTAPARNKPPADADSSSRRHCPRCGTQLMWNYDSEPTCVTCGFCDYSHATDTTSEKEKSLFNAATRDVLRYVGDAPALANILMYVHLVRIRNRVTFAVDCPFCHSHSNGNGKEPMEESPLSGQRSEARERRFRCRQGHRVSLMPSANGMIGWR